MRDRGSDRKMLSTFGDLPQFKAFKGQFDHDSHLSLGGILPVK